jgi:hypothetical protein
MNARLLPEVLIGSEPADQPTLELASERVLRYVWQSAFGPMLIEVADGEVWVNGQRVVPAAEVQRASDVEKVDGLSKSHIMR